MGAPKTVFIGDVDSLPLFLRVKDAARVLNITEHCMYDIIKGPDGPEVRKLGKPGRPMIRLPRDKFLDWANKTTIPAPTRAQRKRKCSASA